MPDPLLSMPYFVDAKPVTDSSLSTVISMNMNCHVQLPNDAIIAILKAGTWAQLLLEYVASCERNHSRRGR